MTLYWILNSTHKHHIIPIQYPSHKWLPEKSCLGCLRILIMSWLFKDPFSDPKWPICPEQNFFRTNPYYYFHLPIGSFYCAIKKFLQRIQSFEDAPFLGPKWSICPKQIFFGKLLIPFSPTYQPLSLCKI